MKIILLIVSIISTCIIFACQQKTKTKNVFSLDYSENDNNGIDLIFENSTTDNIIFPVPNTLHFGDIKTRKLTSVPEMGGFPPLTIYATINPNQSSIFYQIKLDCVYNGYLTEIGNSTFIPFKRFGDGHSVLYLSKNSTLKIKYKLTVKPFSTTSYSSKYKQNYYPYDRILKEKNTEGEYLRRFSKIKFNNAKFVEQPLIKDSLYLSLSQRDVTID
jgi:hypothetical protein